MAWRPIGDKPLPKPMLTDSLTHIYGISGRWDKLKTGVGMLINCYHWPPVMTKLASWQLPIPNDTISSCWYWAIWKGLNNTLDNQIEWEFMKTKRFSIRFQEWVTKFIPLFNAKGNIRIQGPIQYKDMCYWYKDSHYKDSTVIRLSYFCNGNFYIGKMASLYWNNPKGLLVQPYQNRNTYHVANKGATGVLCLSQVIWKSSTHRWIL